MYTFGGAPPYSMPAGVVPGVDVVHEGLGFWGALVPIAVSAIGSAIGGSGTPDNMSRDVYYPDARAGIVHCPGPYDAPQVAAAYDRSVRTNVDPEAGRLRADIIRQLSTDKMWQGALMPADGRGVAGALVAWAHGGLNCTVTDTERSANGALIDRILAIDANRQRNLAQAAAEAARAGAGAVATFAQKPLVGGVSNVVVFSLAAVVALALLRRR